MKSVYHIFTKAIVSDYYKKNALFIFVVVLFAFGFLRGQEHITIVKQINNSPILLLQVALVWLFYGFKVIIFVLRSLSLPEFRFLFAIRLMSFWKRFFVWFFIGVLLNQLTLYYAVFMVVLGIADLKWVSVFIIILVQLLIILFCVLVFELRIRKEPEQALGFTFRLPLSLKYNLPYFLFYHKYLLYREPMLLFLSKGFSILTLLFFIWLYPTDDYDFRLFGIAAVIIAISHLRICSQWLYFQYENLQFYQNLPLSYLYKVSVLILGYFIILLPEIWLFVMKTHILFHTPLMISWIFFVIAMIIFIHFFGYLNFKSEERKGQCFFAGVILVLLLVMYKIPILLLSSIFIVYGLVIYRITEKRFEEGK